MAADTNSPLREVVHTPAAPHTGEAVQITARVSAGVTNLLLQYQVVDPGHYLERQDRAYQTNWSTRPMTMAHPSNQEALFSVELPAALQMNRRLVRYRFSASDASGRTVTLPATNETIPNFGYFIYDGVPAWTGAINPKSKNPRLRAPVAFDANVMRRVQSYFLIGKARSIENVTWREQTGGKEYKYTGTLVADGVVYDHIRMRARGGVWRYALGKNMWKFDLPKGQPLQARDDTGRPYPTPWSKVNLRACIQQADYGQRGEQGMFESVGFRLFNLAGVPAPLTHWIQLRIITEAEENPADQYRGDFWGLYLAIEEVDGRFLKAHGLPDGNVYKMEGGSGTLSHHGAGAVTNRSDLEAFLGSYDNAVPSEVWWRAHLNLPAYFSYRALCECIHHYDIGDGKNYYYFLNPSDRRWEVLPWDIDLTWADEMYGSGEDPFKRHVLPRRAFRLEYQNRLRELRDLLFNPDETGRLIDECAAIIADPAGGPSPVDADRAKWDFHPMMAMGGKAGQGLFYQITPTKNFRGMVQRMKDYVKSRGAWIDATLLDDPNIPAAPSLTYTGPPGFPPHQLSFRASEFRGPNAFAARQWRLAEIAPPGGPRPTNLNGTEATWVPASLEKKDAGERAPGNRPGAPGQYEITPTWESGEMTNDVAAITLPAKAVLGGHRYRARVRMKDTTGRWSHWSAAVEFVAGHKPPS